MNDAKKGLALHQPLFYSGNVLCDVVNVVSV